MHVNYIAGGDSATSTQSRAYEEDRTRRNIRRSNGGGIAGI